MKIKLFCVALMCLTATIVSAGQDTIIYGQVIDTNENDAPISYATIRLLTSDSVMIGGAMTDEGGCFRINTDMPEYGTAIIAASYIGYKTAYINVWKTDTDSCIIIRLVPEPHTLSEVVVRGATVISKNDRKLLIPDAAQARTATDGMDLLRKMQPPRISVNPLSGEINMTGGGQVLLCINGVQTTANELTGIRPEDVVRIEYHDAPGARYPGIDAVIDYITRRKDYGGNISANSLNAAGIGKRASMDNIGYQHSHGKSSWTLNAGYMGQTRHNWIRDYNETWHYPDHDVNRTETGSPVSIGVSMLESSLNYNFTEENKYFFNARFGLNYNYVPNKEEGDRQTLLYTSDNETPLEIYEHTKEHSASPSLDLYLQRTLGNGRQLILDVTGTCIITGSNRTYRECLSDYIKTQTFSDISGRKYSIIAEGVYENNSAHGRLTTGLRHSQAYTFNKYRGSSTTDVSMTQAESHAFAEYSHKTGAWGAMANITVARLYYSQTDRHTEKYAIQPSARITFEPSEHIFMRYGINMQTHAPALSDMSDVEQEIQAGMVRRGNPGLKTWRSLGQHLTAGFSKNIFTMDITMNYLHEYHPIMESVIYENGIFVRTYENQQSFRRLSAEAVFKIHPWQEHVTLSVTPLIYRFFSNGSTYKHAHTMKRLKIDIDFSYGNWVFSYNTMMGPANTMYGEQIIEEKNMSLILAGYKSRKWSLQAGAFNPFMHGYWMKTEDCSQLAPSVSRAHCNKNTYFAMKLSLYIKYGRQVQSAHKKINNEDNDAGIMKGTK